MLACWSYTPQPSLFNVSQILNSDITGALFKKLQHFLKHW